MMKSIDERRDFTERPPNSTTRINNLPDEILYEILIDIFDSCRQYSRHAWWLEIAHVCRRWRAVMFTSAFRLNLSIKVGPEKPDDIETILSSPWPILIDYECKHERPTDSSLKRMQSALEHRDRVLGICLYGEDIWFDDFFKATNCPFPALESLYLRNRDVRMEIPETFLGGPNLSNLRLRSLTLRNVSSESLTILSSATSLTDLCLGLPGFRPSAGMSLLASLQGLHCLRDLDLSLYLLSSPSQPLIPTEVVPLSKLTKFRYNGSSVFLYALVAAISAPSLQDTKLNSVTPFSLPLCASPDLSAR